jgi:hypothetical protein
VHTAKHLNSFEEARGGKATSSMIFGDLMDASQASRSPLGHDCWSLVLERVEDLQTACNLLQTSKGMQKAALAHCAVPLECRPSK